MVGILSENINIIASWREECFFYKNIRWQFDKYQFFFSYLCRRLRCRRMKWITLNKPLRDLVYGRENARLTERKLFRRSRARFCSRSEISRARPRPVTEFLNSWTKSISREGNDAVTYLPRLYLAQEAAREENVAQEEGIISRLTEQGETLPPQWCEWEGMDISCSFLDTTTTIVSYPDSFSFSPSLSFSLFYFYYARLSRHSPRNIPPRRRCTDLLLLVFSFRPFYPESAHARATFRVT